MYLEEQQLIHLIHIFKNSEFQKKYQDGQLCK